jgi:hypothetical protein
MVDAPANISNAMVASQESMPESVYGSSSFSAAVAPVMVDASTDISDEVEFYQMPLNTLSPYLPVPRPTLNAITEIARQVTERALRNELIDSRDALVLRNAELQKANDKLRQQMAMLQQQLTRALEENDSLEVELEEVRDRWQ